MDCSAFSPSCCDSTLKPPTPVPGSCVQTLPSEINQIFAPRSLRLRNWGEGVLNELQNVAYCTQYHFIPPPPHTLIPAELRYSYNILSSLLLALRVSFCLIGKEVPLNKWRSYMIVLGLTDNEIEIAKVNARDDVAEQHFQMLQTWREKSGLKASLDTLLKMLCDPTVDLKGVELKIREALISRHLYVYEEWILKAWMSLYRPGLQNSWLPWGFFDRVSAYSLLKPYIICCCLLVAGPFFWNVGCWYLLPGQKTDLPRKYFFPGIVRKGLWMYPGGLYWLEIANLRNPDFCHWTTLFPYLI